MRNIVERDKLVREAIDLLFKYRPVATKGEPDDKGRTPITIEMAIRDSDFIEAMSLLRASLRRK